MARNLALQPGEWSLLFFVIGNIAPCAADWVASLTNLAMPGLPGSLGDTRELWDVAKHPPPSVKERRRKPLCSCIQTSLDMYFRDLDGHAPSDIYHMVLSQVERPLLESVMRYTQGNQTRAAEVLGINRSTLRKKLDQYGLN